MQLDAIPSPLQRRPPRRSDDGSTSPPLHPKTRAGVASHTGPLDKIALCQRVLVIADVENLVYSARDLASHIDFGALATLLRRSFATVTLDAYFSIPRDDQQLGRMFADFGWTPHPRPIIEHAAGRRFSANADLALAFGAAVELARSPADACIIGTGDGVLALDTARAIRSNFSECRTIATMSVAGATSRLLDARRAPEIDVNIEIGLDVMKSITLAHARSAHVSLSR